MGGGKTYGLIKDMIPKNVLFPEMTLVNTLYYKSKWNTEIKEKSAGQKFYLEDGSSVEASFLTTGEQSLEYMSHDKYSYVLLPMEIGELVLVLPKKGKTPEDIMNEKNINNILAELTSEEKNVVKML